MKAKARQEERRAVQSNLPFTASLSHCLSLISVATIEHLRLGNL